MKYYVVLKWHTTGIFTNRDECKRQVDGFLWAQYKSFSTEQAAQFARKQQDFWQKWQSTWDYLRHIMWQEFEKAICTDAACPSNPWPIERRGVIISTWEEIFKQGPYQWWSVNIAEFLSIIEGLQRIQQHPYYTTLYSDSSIAIWRIHKWKINTTIQKTESNERIFHKIEEGIVWLQWNNKRSSLITLKKRPTSQWWQIPADFWRK